MLKVEIEALNRRFGSLQVLRDVSLCIEPGDFTVLLGPSGCGKSTLLASIAGLDELDGGRILFNGADVTGLEPAERNIGMVFQSYALYPTMTVRQNLSFGLEVARLSRSEIEKRVMWAAQLLKIDPLLARKPGQLSGGQRQRVAIGRALVREAQLFLFDEPLSNLDAKLRTEMRVEIKSLHQRLGATFIYVTHDQVEAMTMATRIAVMNNGRIEQYASPEEIYSQPASLFVADFVGSPPMNLIPAVLRRQDGRIFVECASHLIDVSTYKFKALPDDGVPIVMGIRPEEASLGQATDESAIAAPLLVLEPLGSDTLAWVELAGKRVAIRTTPANARNLQDQLFLSFPPQFLSIFSEATGLRL